MKLLSLPKFSNKDSNKFFRTLNKRVNYYFKESKIRKTGNWKLYLKAVIIFSMFLVPYFVIMIFDPNQWISLMFIILSSIGMAGVGMNVMHDGNHGSFSNKKWVNKLMGSSIYILAGNAYNWQIQHNVLHHTFTNIHGHDEDLAAGRILRFSKHSKWFPYHKYQHFYSFLLYGLMTINWAITGDFLQTIRFLKRKLSFKKLISPKKQWINLIFTKIIYFTILDVLASRGSQNATFIVGNEPAAAAPRRPRISYPACGGTEIADIPADPGILRPARRCAQEQHIPYGYGHAPPPHSNILFTCYNC